MKEGKKLVFVSYANEDYHLVDKLTSIIQSRSDLAPQIIANKREALKPLAEKVSQGIIMSDIVIPILTKNSISAQWINQEIGYSKALNKRILPLVDISLLKSLKGFVHKEIDLPYLFKNETIEDFESVAQTLVNDIPLSMVSDLEEDGLRKNISKAKDYRAHHEYINKKKIFFNSSESIEVVIDEMFDVMFSYLEAQLEVLSMESNIRFITEISDGIPIGYIVKAEGFSFSISWVKKFNNTIEESKLHVMNWERYTSFDNSSFAPSERPKIISNYNFDVDLDRDFKIVWREKQGKTMYSKEIVDFCFSWLIDTIIEKNKMR